MEIKHLVKKVTARDREISYLLSGGVSKFRLEDSIAKRTEQFDKRVRKNRKRNKIAKQLRKGNR